MRPIAEQIKEAKREIQLRKNVYPGLVKRRTLTQGQADYHLTTMEDILRTLERVEVEQRQLTMFPSAVIEETADHA